MNPNAEHAWLRAGAGIFLALAAVFALLRRWKTARVFAGFAAACVVEWREARLGALVARVLAESGRNA